MAVPALNPTVQQALSLHQCTLAASRDAQLNEDVVQVMLSEFPVGHVIDQRGLWAAYAQVRPHAVFGNEEVGRYRSFEDALLAVLANFVE